MPLALNNIVQWAAENRSLLIVALVAAVLISFILWLARRQMEEGEAEDSHGHRPHHGHFNVCPFRPGKGYGWFFGKRFFPAAGLIGWLVWLAIEAESFSLGLIALGLLICFIVYCAKFLTTVGEFTYVVVARLNKPQTTVRGSGLQEIIPGDELHEIARNPISVMVEVTRQVKGGRTATMKNEVTVIPHPRLANEQGYNTFGVWILQERLELEAGGPGHEHEATHHVQDAIKRPLEGMIGAIMSEMTDDEIDQAQHAFALLIESEVALYLPLHRDAGLRRRVEKTPDGNPNPAEPTGLSDVLRWYHKFHRACREVLDELGAEFSDDPYEEIDPESVSSYEVHVGCTFEKTAFIGLIWDAVTTAAKQETFSAGQKVLAAEKLQAAVLASVQGLIDKGVTPDAAAALAAALVDKGSLEGTIIVGNDQRLKSATALGTAFKKGGR